MFVAFTAIPAPVDRKETRFCRNSASFPQPSFEIVDGFVSAGMDDKISVRPASIKHTDVDDPYALRMLERKLKRRSITIYM